MCPQYKLNRCAERVISVNPDQTSPQAIRSRFILFSQTYLWENKGTVNLTHFSDAIPFSYLLILYSFFCTINPYIVEHTNICIFVFGIFCTVIF